MKQKRGEQNAWLRVQGGWKSIRVSVSIEVKIANDGRSDRLRQTSLREAHGRTGYLRKRILLRMHENLRDSGGSLT